MKRYDSYKDSGIEWIGEIPSHWESWKISHAFNRIGSGTTPESGNPIYHENGTVNWLNTGDLNDGFLDSCSKQITQKALEDYSSLKLFPAGSLVMAMYGATIGKTAILNFETTTNQACCVFCESEIINLRFLQYWIIGNKERIINLAIGGGQPNISQNILKDIRLWCPDYYEQISLANYLDQKTAQIDDLIAKKERLIQLLEEERTAIINQAVTKGLDPTVPMKDSGIDWLGEIPTHWEVGKIKNFSKIISKGTTPSTVGREIIDNGNIRYIKSENIIDNNLSQIPEFYIDDETNEILKRSKLEINDVLIVIAGASIGKVAILSEEFYPSNTNQAVSFIRLNNPNSSLFLWYWLQTSYVKEKIQLDATQAAQPNISMENIGNLSFPKISQKEENEITTFLKIKTLEIDTIISKTLQEIEFLKEYKTALISEVVTGKVDVRYEKLN